MNTFSAEAFDFVRKMKPGYVVSVCADGLANLSLKGTLTAFDEHHLIFADMASSQALAQSKHAPVTVEVTDPFSRKGYRFRGKATSIPVKQEAAAYIAFYENWGLEQTASRVNHFVVIEVESCEAFMASGFSWVTTETVRESWKESFNNPWKF